jgi:hypothetical protein
MKDTAVLLGVLAVFTVWLLVRRMPWGRKRRNLRCSFCKKSEQDVAKLISGPAVLICDACVAICQKILTETTDPGPRAPEPQPTAS